MATTKEAAEYEEAREAVRVAQRAFDAVVADYRARKVDDAAYHAAKAEMDKADAAYEVAFAKAAKAGV